LQKIERSEVRFTESMLTRPPLSRWDVTTMLKHFAIVTYAVDPARVRPHVHDRFALETFTDEVGSAKAWVSVVPFEDQDFRFAGAPWLKFRFGQTNYRTYVLDRVTGQRLVWFFGTTLASPTVALPRYVWKLPWHRGQIQFDCSYDSIRARYTKYRMTTRSKWAPAQLELEDSGLPVTELQGCADLEAGLVILTHPLLGVFYRRDGALGAYRIWHDRLRLSTGGLVRAEIGLFDRLGLVSFAEQLHPHSILLQHQTEFTIYLPPRRF
jgi:hypothetical protein